MGTKIGVGWTRKNEKGTVIINPKFNSELLPLTIDENKALSFIRHDIQNEKQPDWDIYIEDIRNWSKQQDQPQQQQQNKNGVDI